MVKGFLVICPNSTEISGFLIPCMYIGTEFLYADGTMQTWIILSLISAFSLATSDALTKRVITHENEYVIAWFRIVCALPALTAATALSGPLPKIDGTFFTAFFAALPLEIISILLYYKALRLSPLSLTLPFLSVTPIFLIVISYVLIGQRVSALGAAGIALIGLGGYTLNLSAFHSGFFEPFRAIVRERGSLYMLIIAFIYGVTSGLGKVGVEHSSAPFFGATYYLALAICMLPIIVRGSGERRLIDLLKGNIRTALLPALFDATATVSYFYAVSMVNVAYMIAVKRTSLLIGVLYGFLLFGERRIRERLLGALLMFAGFVLIAIFA
jgi:drug/metabolite transporter (DMT)-like permease